MLLPEVVFFIIMVLQMFEFGSYIITFKLISSHKEHDSPRYWRVWHQSNDDLQVQSHAKGKGGWMMGVLPWLKKVLDDLNQT